MDIETYIQSLIGQGIITQDEIDKRVAEINQENQTNPQGIHKNIKLITDQTKINLDTVSLEDEINQKIQSGEITSSNFSSLSVDEQNLVKLVLFKNYSPSLYEVPKKLSAIEFLLVGAIQFMDKTIDKSKLTTDELSYWNGLMTFVTNAQQPINDTTDWRFVYAQDEFNKTQDNRNKYFTEKQSIVG